MTNPHTITLTIGEIRAMLCFAASSDVRFYLEAIHVERRAGRTMLVSTDGHVMGVLTVDTTPVGVTVPADFNALMPRTWLEQIVKAAGAGTRVLGHSVAITVTPNSTENTPLPSRLSATIHAGKAAGTTLNATAVDGRFPDWRRVLPPVQAERGKQYHAARPEQPHRPFAAQLDPRLLIRFQDAGAYLAGGRPNNDSGNRIAVRWVAARATTHGSFIHDAHLVAINGQPTFVGVVMPLRDDGEETIAFAERELAMLRGEPAAIDAATDNQLE